MKRILLLLAALCGLCACVETPREHPMPYLDKSGEKTQLVVDGRPYLILGGELWNSSASSPDYMARAGIWDRLQATGLNTALVPVYWELIAPAEGVFDFSTLGAAIREAAQRDLRLVLLWFSSWKNSMSCYVPGWMKRQFGTKYPLVREEQGRTLEILSPFSELNRKQDERAFVALMNHLKAHDCRRTVIMVQVENEIGMLQSARDHSAAADSAYYAAAPQPLIDYLKQQGDQCHPRLYEAWQRQGAPTTGTWEELLGAGIDTEEFFMAYHFATYVEAIVRAGKEVYNLPMYVNAALNSRGRKAGEYPSAGPLAHLWDVWHLAAPSIDFLAPDIYDPLFPEWIAQYDRAENPLFVPEIQHEPRAENGARVFYAVGRHHALGFSPYAIDDATPEKADYALKEAYTILRNLSDEVLRAQREGRIHGVWFDHAHRETVLSIGDVELCCRHDLPLGWSPQAAHPEQWSETAALVIELANDEFLVAGTGVVITMRPRDAATRLLGIERIDELDYRDPSLRVLRRLNGDENHQGRHLRIPFGSYGVQRVKLYRVQ